MSLSLFSVSIPISLSTFLILSLLCLGAVVLYQYHPVIYRSMIELSENIFTKGSMQANNLSMHNPIVQQGNLKEKLSSSDSKASSEVSKIKNYRVIVAACYYLYAADRYGRSTANAGFNAHTYLPTDSEENIIQKFASEEQCLRNQWKARELCFNVRNSALSWWTREYTPKQADAIINTLHQKLEMIFSSERGYLCKPEESVLSCYTNLNFRSVTPPLK